MSDNIKNNDEVSLIDINNNFKNKLESLSNDNIFFTRNINSIKNEVNEIDKLYNELKNKLEKIKKSNNNINYIIDNPIKLSFKDKCKYFGGEIKKNWLELIFYILFIILPFILLFLFKDSEYISFSDLKTYLFFPYFIVLIGHFITKIDSPYFYMKTLTERMMIIIIGIGLIISSVLYIYTLKEKNPSEEALNKIDSIEKSIINIEKQLSKDLNTN